MTHVSALRCQNVSLNYTKLLRKEQSKHYVEYITTSLACRGEAINYYSPSHLLVILTSLLLTSPAAGIEAGALGDTCHQLQAGLNRRCPAYTSLDV